MVFVVVRFEYIMLFNLPIIVSGNSAFISKIIPNISEVVTKIVRIK